MIFHVKLQIHINFLDFFLSKLQIQINLLDFSCQKHKFSWFHILNHKFKLIFLTYYKFWYFLLFLLSKFKFEWRIFFSKIPGFYFWHAAFSRLFQFWILTCNHSKWDLVGDSGGSPGSENAVVGSRQIRLMQVCSLLYLWTRSEPVKNESPLFFIPREPLKNWIALEKLDFSWAHSYLFTGLHPME